MTDGARRKRPHPAASARVAAAGLSVATMLGAVGLMAQEPTAGAVATPAVVVSPTPTVGGAATGEPGRSAVVAPDPDTPAVAATPAPTVVVAVPTPNSTTHGSR